MQLAHAGRKASTDQQPWRGGAARSRCRRLAAGGAQRPALRAGPPTPHALSVEETAARGAIPRRCGGADAAGFDTVEIHAAHGYLLLHEFLALSTARTDAHGSSPTARACCARVVMAVRWWEPPAPRPLLVRVSATDWAPGGWDIDECVSLGCAGCARTGVDLIDVSSGGPAHARVPAAPNYQVPFAARIRHEGGHCHRCRGTHHRTRAGAGHRMDRGEADLVLMAREFLRDLLSPAGPLRPWARYRRAPPQYLRAPGERKGGAARLDPAARRAG